MSIRAVGSLMGYYLTFASGEPSGVVDKGVFSVYDAAGKLAEGVRDTNDHISLTPFAGGVPISWDDADFELDDIIVDFRKIITTFQSYGIIDSHDSLRDSIVDSLHETEDGLSLEVDDSADESQRRTFPFDALRNSTSGSVEGMVRLLLMIDAMGSDYKQTLAAQGGVGAVAVGLFGSFGFTYYGAEYPLRTYAKGDIRYTPEDCYAHLRLRAYGETGSIGPMHAVAALEGDFDWDLSLSDLVDLFTPGFDTADHG